MLKRLSILIIASLPEIIAVTGAVCLVHGASLIHESCGWIMAGLVLALGAREIDRSVR